MEDGTEVRLYDPKREPPKWTGIVLGTECAVFLSDVSTSGPLSRKAKPFPSPAEANCVVFDSLDAAQRFCESTVEEHPSVRCEVLDGHGRSHPPMLVIIHPAQQRLDVPGAAWSRRRKLISDTAACRRVPDVLDRVTQSRSDDTAHVFGHQHDDCRPPLSPLGFRAAACAAGTSAARRSASPAGTSW